MGCFVDQGTNFTFVSVFTEVVRANIDFDEIRVVQSLADAHFIVLAIFDCQIIIQLSADLRVVVQNGVHILLIDLTSVPGIEYLTELISLGGGHPRPSFA